MDIIGRVREKRMLEDAINSSRSEFVAIYGRRRVGKTFLVRKYFGDRFSFYATGVANKRTNEQLMAFNEWLTEYGCTEKGRPTNWFDAFSRLKQMMNDDRVYREPTSGKIIIFLDELPWMDTARSDFKSALDMFWNGWASSREDIVLIVCGSATSWVITNLIHDTGGFYNRVTKQIYLAPFSLGECEQLLQSNGVSFHRKQILDLYMIMGGIPFYLNYIDKRLSLSQNIDTLMIDEKAPLHYEFDMLMKSLFKNAKKHIAIIEALSKRNYGVTRKELAAIDTIGDGEPLTKALNELEQCGFVRKYKNYAKSKQGFFFQITDPFVLFYFRYMKDDKIRSWSAYKDERGYFTWRGLSFEMVCINHIKNIKSALGISGIISDEYSWRSIKKTGGAQIDLIIDRKDDVINICEMKYTDEEYEMSINEERNIRNKVELFKEEQSPKKAIHPTIITVSGLKRNQYSDIFLNTITIDEMFEIVV